MTKNNEESPPTLLHMLEDKQKRSLLNRAVRKKFKKGSYLVRAQETDSNFYILESGRVRVTLFSNDGREVVFVELGRGQNFGELSAIDGLPRSANVMALEDGEVYVISPPLFRKLIEENPDVCFALLSQLSAVVRRLGERVFEFTSLTVTQRVYVELLKLAHQNKQESPIVEVADPPTQVEVANKISGTREAVSRTYAELQKQGLLGKKAKALIIHTQGLEALVRKANGY